jgi:hypothetical protein
MTDKGTVKSRKTPVNSNGRAKKFKTGLLKKAEL